MSDNTVTIRARRAITALREGQVVTVERTERIEVMLELGYIEEVPVSELAAPLVGGAPVVPTSAEYPEPEGEDQSPADWRAWAERVGAEVADNASAATARKAGRAKLAELAGAESDVE